jgi:AraC family transcriptional activator of pobA
MKHIPIHKLAESENIGLEIRHSADVDIVSIGKAMGIHRDDHYIFFLMEAGTASMMIDFAEVSIPEQSIYYVLPGQVHHRIDHIHAQGWFLAVDTLLVPKEFRLIFENQLLLQQPYQLNQQQYQHTQSLIQLLNNYLLNNKQSPFYVDILRSLLNAFTGVAACGYHHLNHNGSKHSRPVQIAQEFKSLVSDSFKIEKRPIAYAGMLNITEAYLNEVLKKATGFPVSYWITHEVILEAKRLLYYTQLNVKEIAHQLGYDDHTYFSRLFKKTAGVTPLGFRSKYTSSSR